MSNSAEPSPNRMIGERGRFSTSGALTGAALTRSRTRLRHIEQRLLIALGLFVFAILFGASGFLLIEPGWSPLDAFYMAVMTVTTVGYMEVHPLSGAGRAFNVLFIVVGVGSFLFAVTAVVNYVIAGELGGLLERRKMQQRVQSMRDHYIVCGFGRMGQQVAREFRREKIAFLIVDRTPAALERAAELGYAVLQGDAGNDEVLREAGVDRARGLVSVVDDDAGNLMVVLSAKALNPKLFVVARANQEATQSKLVTAGADRVLWPYGISGRRIAQMALRPAVVEFLEVVMHDEELQLWMEEYTIAIGAAIDGKTIGETAIRSRTGANIVAIRKRTGELTTAPVSDTRLEAGDIMIAIGTREQIGTLRQLAHHPES